MKCHVYCLNSNMLWWRGLSILSHFLCFCQPSKVFYISIELSIGYEYDEYEGNTVPINIACISPSKAFSYPSIPSHCIRSFGFAPPETAVRLRLPSKLSIGLAEASQKNFSHRTDIWLHRDFLKIPPVDKKNRFWNMSMQLETNDWTPNENKKITPTEHSKPRKLSKCSEKLLSLLPLQIQYRYRPGISYSNEAS